MVATAKNYAHLTSIDQVNILAKKLLADGKRIGFDVETGYLGPDREKAALDVESADQFVCGFSITNDKKWARYVPLAHDFGPNLPEHDVWDIMQPVLETLPTVCHHFKFEDRNLRALEWKERGPLIAMNYGGDTMLDAYVLSEWQGVGLKDLVLANFNHKMMKIEELFAGLTAKKMRCLRFNVLELTPEVVAYACEDAAWTLALDEKIHERAKSERKVISPLEDEITLLLSEMQIAGMHVEWDEMENERRNAIPFRDKMEKATKESLGKLANRDLTSMNINSPAQLKQLLYRDLGYHTTRKTKSADLPKNAHKDEWELMSTDAVAMESLSKKHPEIKKILELREVENALNRFSKWLDNFRTADDKRIHPNFNQVAVGTGRFAANDPPVQQMPKEWRWTTSLQVNVWDDEEWETFINNPDTKPHVDYWTGNFRDYITAAPGCYLIGYDYSQVELRVMAGVSQEPVLLEAFENDRDVHTITAAMMLQKDPADITKKDRDIGKTMNFALLYQMGPKSLAERLAITMPEAKDLYNSYFAQFASITTWMQRARQLGLSRGYAETPFGRKYTVWELQHAESGVKAKGERVLINAPIQGGAADYMKMAMVRARRILKKEDLWLTKVWMVHNLHDALVFEVDNSVDPNELRDTLQTAVVFPVKGFPKIKADWELGQKHGSATAWKPGMIAAFNEDTNHWELVKEPNADDDTPADQLPDTIEAAEEKTVDDLTALKHEQPTNGQNKGENTPPQTDPLVSTSYTTPPAAASPTPTYTNGPTALIPQDNNDTQASDAPKTAGASSLILEIPEMPTQGQMNSLKQLIKDTPGQTDLMMRTPQGDVHCPTTTGLSMKNSGDLLMIFPDCKLSAPADSVDVDALAAGLKL